MSSEIRKTSTKFSSKLYQKNESSLMTSVTYEKTQQFSSLNGELREEMPFVANLNDRIVMGNSSEW